MGFIFPGIVLLSKMFGSPHPGGFASCTSFSFELTGIVIFVFALTVITWPLGFRRFNSALYFMAWAFPWTMTTALWFFLGGTAIVLCADLPYSGILLPATNTVFLVLSILIFWFFLRPRLSATLNNNPQKWDFEKMQFSLLSPVISAGGMRRTKSGFVALLVTVGSILIIPKTLDLVLMRYMSSSTAKDWEAVFLLMLISYGCLLIALGQAFTIYLVYMRCKVIGAKLRIKEFSDGRNK